MLLPPLLSGEVGALVSLVVLSSSISEVPIDFYHVDLQARRRGGDRC